jgi:hypothetical protein
MKRIDFHNTLISLGFRNVTKNGTDYRGDKTRTTYFIKKPDEMFFQVFEDKNGPPQPDLNRITISISAEDGDHSPLDCVRFMDAETTDDMKKAIINTSVDFLKRLIEERHKLQAIEDHIVKLQLTIQNKDKVQVSPVKAPELSEEDKLMKRVIDLVVTKYGGSMKAYYDDIVSKANEADIEERIRSQKFAVPQFDDILKNQKDVPADVHKILSENPSNFV